MPGEEHKARITAHSLRRTVAVLEQVDAPLSHLVSETRKGEQGLSPSLSIPFRNHSLHRWDIARLALMTDEQARGRAP